MVLRKRKITFIIISIILTIIIGLTIVGILYFKTDTFKTTETLFAKYFVQNFDIIELLKSEDTLEIQKKLYENPYESKVEGKIEYTENIGTSDENKNNQINNLKLQIDSNIDNLNDYEYRNIDIKNNKENLLKFEYIKQQQERGIRLEGIQQFVSNENNDEKDILKYLEIENIENLITEINIKSILNFSEEEKQKLINTYMPIIQNRITKDKYYKQSNSLITVNNNDVNTNAYYVKITIEEFNNILIDILTQFTKDEIILSRIDLIENEIKARYTKYNEDENLRTKVINKINSKITDIQNNNIGNDEVRITVYENNNKNVRTVIEKGTEKTSIELYNNATFKIHKIETNENQKEILIELQKQKDEFYNNVIFNYKKVQNEETINELKINYNEKLNNNQISRNIDIEICNLRNKGKLNIANNINLVSGFSDKITLDTNNVNIKDLNEEQLTIVLELLKQTLNKQLENLSSVIKLQDFKKIIQNLGFSKNTAYVEIPTEVEVSEIEKKRFNSQFEFFVSENLTVDNIKELVKATEDNLEDIKVLLKTEEIQDLDIEKLKESQEYIKNISEILFFIKRNTYNNTKKQDVIKLLEASTINKYNVNIQYDDIGLTRLIRVKVQE